MLTNFWHFPTYICMKSHLITSSINTIKFSMMHFFILLESLWKISLDIQFSFKFWTFIEFSMTKKIQNSISLARTFILPMWFGCMYYIIRFGMFIQSPWKFSLKGQVWTFSLSFKKKLIILAHPISSLVCYFEIDFYSKFHINNIFQNSTFNF